MTYLDATRAQALLDAAGERARQINVNACIAIVDSGGHLLAFKRMDGAAVGPIDVSQRKARTSALFCFDSGDFGKVVRDADLTGMENSNGGLALFAGGVPIFTEAGIAGAIGVSGGSAEQDKDIASYALSAVDRNR